MLCAAVDTSGSTILTVVTDGDGRVLGAGAHEHTAGNASRLSGILADCVDEAGVELSDLERLGAGVGPGSFIGTRTGVAFINAVATSLSLPVVALNSLQTAAAVTIREASNVMVVRCGRRNAYFVGEYKRGSDSMRAVPVETEREVGNNEIPRLLEHVAEMADSDGVHVVTDSKDFFNELESQNPPARVDAVLRENVVDIRGMALLAAQEISAGRTKPWVDVAYLRPAAM